MTVRRRLALAAFAIAALAAPARSNAASLLSGLGGPAGYGNNRMYLNDDGSTCPGMPGAIDLSAAFPSGLTFFGMTYNNICINNNGNCTFGGGLGTYTPMAFPVASLRMIAPWWGDVDTRGGSLSDPDHDAVYWDVRPGQFTVTWHNVGYFGTHDDLQNDFQMVLRTFAGCGVGAFDVEFRYNRCEWTTGDASGGHGGLGGTPAQAGFDAGDRSHYYALPGSLSMSILNLCTTSNVGEMGVWRFRIRGGELPCSGSGMACDTGMQGACAAGTTECRSGAAVCIQNQQASTERCDGIDNDCNGMIDDPPAGGSLCAAGFVCDRGACQPTCVEGGCFTGQTCTMEGTCIDNTCLTVTCPAGQRCQAGMCVDACAGIHCPAPAVCQSGGCVVPCEGVTCAAGEVCDMGFCQSSCMCRECPMNYSCSADGTCQPTDCIGLDCPPGQICHSALLDEPGGMARCVDPCDGAVCPEGQHCDTGRCVNGAPPPDAGGNDASTDDSGEGGITDSSVSDASGGDGSMNDAARGDGAGDGGFAIRKSGCGCSTVGDRDGVGRAGIAAIALAGVALVITRRRRSVRVRG